MRRSYIAASAIDLVLLLWWFFAARDIIPETPEGAEAEALATD